MASRDPRPALHRDLSRARWAGVCAGLAAHLGWPVLHIRLLLAGLLLVGGVGGAAYLVLWVLVPAGGTPPAPRVRWVLTPQDAGQLVVGAGLLALGLAELAGRYGVPFGGPLAFGGVVMAALAAAWGLVGRVARSGWQARVGAEGSDGARRLATGLVMGVAGLAAVAVLGDVTTTLGPVLLSVAGVLAGATLIFAPLGVRLARALREERSARAEIDQRAEVAAHLHDSVLQTLALLQRRSDDPVEVARLARAQERELRAWLYGTPPPGGADGPSTLAAAARAEVADVEDTHAVPVEVVTVGDRPLDTGGGALVAALREAVLNAVRHGRPAVQVYLEVAPDGVEAFVRDHGAGFDPAAVPPDRWGVRESIVGRMARAGGSASVRRAPGGGTEVALRLPPTGPVAAPTPAPATGSSPVGPRADASARAGEGGHGG